MDIKENVNAASSENEEILDETAEAVSEDLTQESTEPKKKQTKKEKKISELEKMADDLAQSNEKYMRLMAEYDNFRKRTAKEKSEIYSDATIRAVNDILPIYDNFERALMSESSDENFKKGVEMIFGLFSETLKKMNIEVIDPTGQEFDPNIAQAVNQIEDENLGANTVAQVFQKGYKLGDKIIRYAMVVVANP